MDTSTLSKDEIDFSTVYGTLFSLSTTLEYLTATMALMKERNAKNLANRALEAEKACQIVHNALEYEITKKMSSYERDITLSAVEHHKDTVYGYFVLNTDNQRKVKELMNTLREEQLK